MRPARDIIINIVRDIEGKETLGEFTKRVERTSLTIDGQHHYEDVTENQVKFVLYLDED